MEKFDLIVIGAGPAGEKGASKAAQYGKRVALIERAPYLGGAGINTGTVPSKTLRESALYFSGLRQRGLYGIDYSLRENLTIKDFMYRERTVVDKERSMIAQTVRQEKITLIHGEGSLRDAHTVRIRSGQVETEVSGEFILIATGSSPHHPPGIPFDGKLVFDSDTILNMKRIPRSMAVIGGGVIGTEYASIFTALAAVVHAFNLEYKEKLAPFVPLAVYAIPEISAIGLTEDDCRAQNIPYLVGRAYYEENARGQIIGDMSGMIKLVFSSTDRKLLGTHIIGEQASELIHIASHVILTGGPIDAFIDAVYNYPTLSVSYQYAAYDGLANHTRWMESRQ